MMTVLSARPRRSRPRDGEWIRLPFAAEPYARVFGGWAGSGTPGRWRTP